MNLNSIIRPVFFISLFFVTINSIRAMQSDVATDGIVDEGFVTASESFSRDLIPKFEMASPETNQILSSYKDESNCQQLFENKFPVSDFNSIIEIVKVILEIKTFTYADRLTDEAREKMKEISRNLSFYLHNEFKKNKAIILPQMKSTWHSLPEDQQQFIYDAVLEPSVMRNLGKFACKLTILGITTAFVIANYMAFKDDADTKFTVLLDFATACFFNATAH